MKNLMFALATVLLFPTVALAEPEASPSSKEKLSGIDIDDAKNDTIRTPDQHQLDSQLDEGATSHVDLDDTGKPPNAAGPFIIAPKFDFGAGLSKETDSSINPYEPVPEPAPGFAIKIPTN
jgi:hypothetical protein